MVMQMHNESTLPKWAQQRIAEFRQEASSSKEELKTIRATYNLLKDRTYVVISLDDEFNNPPIHDTRRLYLLNRDDPIHLYTIEEGDIILVGRANPRGGKTDDKL